MPTQLASLGSLVHPHQMEIQEFASYALVIDARSAEAYQEDHIPGAVNVPITPTTNSGHDASSMGLPALCTSEPAPSMADELAARAQGLSSGDTVLVYCDRGGLGSMVWATPLRAAGFRVDVLGGGWGNYRRWVNAGLEVLPRVLTFRRLVAPPVSGMRRLLDVLARRGEQVLDLAPMAGQRLVPGMTLPGDGSPSQSAFDTAVLDAMRRLDPRRPVWVREGIVESGQLAVPPSLRDALMRSDSIRLEVPLQVRALAWLERLQITDTSMEDLLHAISVSAVPPPLEILEHWRTLANAGHVAEALAAIIADYIDPRSAVVPTPARVEVVHLPSLEANAIAAEVDAWLGRDAAEPPSGTN